MNENNKPKIIQASPQHLDLLAPLFNAYRVFYEQESDVAGARAYLLARLQALDCVVFLALNPNDAQEAWGFTLLYPTFCSVTMRRFWVLYDLYVDGEKRRWGIGRTLMERAHAFAREMGGERVELATAVDNIPGQTLYESMGYVRDTEFYSYSLTLEGD